MLSLEQLKAWRFRQGMTLDDIANQWTINDKKCSKNYISMLLSGAEPMREVAYKELCRILANGKEN